MYELVFHSTCANAHPWNALPLIDPSIDRHFLVWPSKHPRLLDSACACVLVDPSQITISNPAAESSLLWSLLFIAPRLNFNNFFLDISSLPSFLSPSTITVLDLTS